MVDARTTSEKRINPFEQFGDYVVLDVIARGGTGIVYNARQVSLNRPVALKVFYGNQISSPESLRRLRIEAESLARLEHPGILAIYQVGEVSGQYFISTKLIEKGSLADALATGQLQPLVGTDGPVLDPARSEADVGGRAAVQADRGRLRPRESGSHGPAVRDRSPKIALIVAKIARAIQHAHLRGVLHLDLKPGNILLQTEDDPILADFGNCQNPSKRFA